MHALRAPRFRRSFVTRRSALRCTVRLADIARPMHTARPREGIDMRRGVLLIELIITGVVLGGILTMVVPTLTWVGHERRATERHQQALSEAANMMERLAALPWDSLTDESIEKLGLDAQVGRTLPGARLAISLHTPPGQAGSRRLALELAWPDQPGKRAAVIRLSAWRHRQTGAGS